MTAKQIGIRGVPHGRAAPAPAGEPRPWPRSEISGAELGPGRRSLTKDLHASLSRDTATSELTRHGRENARAGLTLADDHPPQPDTDSWSDPIMKYGVLVQLSVFLLARSQRTGTSRFRRLV